MLFGIIGVFISLYKYIMSESNAYHLMEKVTGQAEMFQRTEDKYMNRDTYILYDTFKNISMLTFLICFMTLILGCKGKCAAWMQNSWMSKKSMRCCGIFTILISILGVLLVFQSKEIKRVMKRHQGYHAFQPMPEEVFPQDIDQETQSEKEKEAQQEMEDFMNEVME